MGTILGKGFAQAQVHTEFIAREPKAPVCYELYARVCMCDNYVPQWRVEFNDELSW